MFGRSRVTSSLVTYPSDDALPRCPCFTTTGLPCRHNNIDIVMIRENTEGEYSGIEHEVVPGVTEALKVRG